MSIKKILIVEDDIILSMLNSRIVELLGHKVIKAVKSGEEAIEFARVVRAGEIESPLMMHAKSQEIMELMDEIRRQIGVKYPTE